MRISLNWLKKFVKIKVSDEELVRLIGARLVEVEGVIDESHKYDKIYVAKVVSAEKIPETHLTKCVIDVGSALSGTGSRPPAVAGAAPLAISVVTSEAPRKGHDPTSLVQVMCGAPNVREGMLAVWIAPGAIVPASVHEDAPFVIGKRKMLGKYDSYGMLAGADELDFGDDHSGIVEIDPEEAKAGDLLADVFGLDDKILEIENKSLTHRPDCFGLIGFAREVAGILGEKFRSDFPGTGSRPPAVAGAAPLAISVVTSEAPRKAHSKLLSIDASDSTICPRYSAIILEKHGEMKKKYLSWTDTILAKSGMRPIDPIVDATNYLMLLTGQPLHAFDYDKFVAVGGTDKPKIIVRLAKKGEKLELLDGKKIDLIPTDIVITSNNVPVALAGAMGGANTEIDENTRNIIIEAATFSLYNLRKTQMAHGIFSEAITRFTKGQPPYQTLHVGEACAEMLSDGFRVAGIADEYPKPEKSAKVMVSVSEISNLLGTGIRPEKIVKTLENVGFEVRKRREELVITAPAWRTDIHIPEDIIEEVGRLLGYDNILPNLPKHQTAEQNKMMRLKTRVAETLKSFGANEVLTYSFVSERLIKKAGLEAKNSYKIVNSISPELQLVRQTIAPSLLEKAYMNQKFPVDKFAMFEINKVYQKEWGMDEEGVPAEKMRLGFVIAERKGTGTAFYAAKNYVSKLLDSLGIEVSYVPLKNKNAIFLPFEGKRAAEIWAGARCLGVVGEFKNSVRRNFKLEPYLAGFEVDMEALLELAVSTKKVGQFVVKDKQDVTIVTKKSYAEALSEVAAKYPEAKITPVGIYQPAGVEARNITFHLEWTE